MHDLHRLPQAWKEANISAIPKEGDKQLPSNYRPVSLTGNISGWLENFLQCHKQRIIVNRATSLPVPSVIPQGSVIGPLLFVLYINDLPDVVKSEIYLFANDTKIYHKITIQADCDILQADLRALDEWSCKWLRLFHPEKCEVMNLGRQ